MLTDFSERADPLRQAVEKNCMAPTTMHAGSVLVDGAAYFSTLQDAIKTARNAIVIVAWDFDGRVRLRHDGDDTPTIGDLLRRCVEDRPSLTVKILVWSVAVLHAPSSTDELLFGTPWQDHPRIDLRLDTTHPFYGSHHQKIVAVDDSIAFIGGMDVTVDRWDTSQHRLQEPTRLKPDGKPYGPVHDVQIMLNGPAAAQLGDIARERWRQATGENVPAPDAPDPQRWLASHEPRFRGCAIGFSKTMPCWGKRQRIRQGYHLTIDLLRAARRHIYIEAQYFSAPYVGDVLAETLARDTGPEIVIVASKAAHSKIERWILGKNQDRLIRRLAKADRHGRLRAYYPVVRDGERCEPLLIHAKVMVIDDLALRIGSSNLNNRSIELDTELDATILAATPSHEKDISLARRSLTAEHIGVTVETVADCETRFGSLIQAIENCASTTRQLVPFESMHSKGSTRQVFCTGLFDPTCPFEPSWWLKLRG